MSSEKVTYCEKLMKDTNEIISRLDTKAIGGIVQWGDLRCISVQWIENYTGHEVETVWRVVVEKAHSRAHELKKAISEGLAERGHFGIEVELNR